MYLHVWDLESPQIKKDTLCLVGDEVSYDPRVAPNWVFNDEDADKSTFSDLVTKGRAIYSFIVK